MQKTIRSDRLMVEKLILIILPFPILPTPNWVKINITSASREILLQALWYTVYIMVFP